jgi:hypothetical protein
MKRVYRMEQYRPHLGPIAIVAAELGILAVIVTLATLLAR